MYFITCPKCSHVTHCSPEDLPASCYNCQNSFEADRSSSVATETSNWRAITPAELEAGQLIRINDDEMSMRQGIFVRKGFVNQPPMMYAYVVLLTDDGETTVQVGWPVHLDVYCPQLNPR